MKEIKKEYPLLKLHLITFIRHFWISLEGLIYHISPSHLINSFVIADDTIVVITCSDGFVWKRNKLLDYFLSFIQNPPVH